MSACEHDKFCPGEGAQHDADTLGPERLANLLAQAKPLIRSGSPVTRATGLALKARVLAAMEMLPKEDDDEDV